MNAMKEQLRALLIQIVGTQWDHTTVIVFPVMRKLAKLATVNYYIYCSLLFIYILYRC